MHVLLSHLCRPSWPPRRSRLRRESRLSDWMLLHRSSQRYAPPLSQPGCGRAMACGRRSQSVWAVRKDAAFTGFARRKAKLYLASSSHRQRGPDAVPRISFAQIWLNDRFDFPYLLLARYFFSDLDQYTLQYARDGLEDSESYVSSPVLFRPS
jgi:hypothetical protein